MPSAHLLLQAVHQVAPYCPRHGVAYWDVSEDEAVPGLLCVQDKRFAEFHGVQDSPQIAHYLAQKVESCCLWMA